MGASSVTGASDAVAVAEMGAAVASVPPEAAGWPLALPAQANKETRQLARAAGVKGGELMYKLTLNK
ncbi:hypothetical protein W822_07780 [Advenella kashmirensis W13003]|uniref:Uncharacterized protein n=1 Tax=Advenella kashmirensis W13003 TaxID=1424334 RepID=V8QUZ3_9BURK|nr:hypothetical protein W822_07780 [Advenella kashmirensis W13003]